MNGMTIKQVAELCQVDESTIYRWIQKGASAECKASLAKCKAANEENKPARFTLPETIAIIKAGGRSTLADLLQEGITVYLLHKFMEQLPPLTSADFAEGCSNIFNKSVSNVRNDTITTYADCTPTPWLAGAQDQGI